MNNTARGYQMQLEQILDRFSEGLVVVDREFNFINSSRNGIKYLPGLSTIYEPQCAEEVMTWWKNTYPKDFHNLKNISTNYPYPEADKEAALTEFADQIFDHLVSKQKDQN
jgi:hypothetical protein